MPIGRMALLIGLAGAALCRFTPGLIALLPMCHFRTWTTLPCPSCGATSAAIALSHAHPGDALRLNPLFTLLYLGMAATGLNALAALVWKRALVLDWRPVELRIMLGSAFVLLWLNWIFLLGARFALF